MKKITLAALFCALLVICSIISVPTPFGVPVTLQTFGVLLLAFCLPLKYSLVCYLAYVALGACGLPVFSSFGGGLGVLLGPTGGFIWGFLFTILICALEKRISRFKWLLGIGGILICHICGAVQFSIVTKANFVTAVAVCCLPFVLKDILLLLLARPIAKRISRHF